MQSNEVAKSRMCCIIQSNGNFLFCWTRSLPEGINECIYFIMYFFTLLQASCDLVYVHQRKIRAIKDSFCFQITHWITKFHKQYLISVGLLLKLLISLLSPEQKKKEACETATNKRFVPKIC